ncbi:hypothetical protein D3C87_2031800 [compost metagenome]
MHHRLLVAALVVTEVGIFLQCLAKPGHIAVPENAEAAAKIWLLDAVALDILVF